MRFWEERKWPGQSKERGTVLNRKWLISLVHGCGSKPTSGTLVAFRRWFPPTGRLNCRLQMEVHWGTDPLPLNWLFEREHGVLNCNQWFVCGCWSTSPCQASGHQGGLKFLPLEFSFSLYMCIDSTIFWVCFWICLGSLVPLVCSLGALTNNHISLVFVLAPVRVQTDKPSGFRKLALGRLKEDLQFVKTESNRRDGARVGRKFFGFAIRIWVKSLGSRYPT